METVPMPEVLDADRLQMPDDANLTIDDHADRVGMLRGELRRSCEYGRDLWQVLQRAREYLVESLPDEPARDGTRSRGSATPVGARDDDGWQQWMTMYASVTSALAGPRGDSGFGAQEAQVIAQHRRASHGA